MLKARDPEFILYDLEAIGVPAFDLLGELLQRRPEEVKKLARSGRLQSPKVCEALVAAYTIRYKGMAETLATKRRGDR